MLRVAFPGKWDEKAVKGVVTTPANEREEAAERNKMIEIE